MAKYESYYFIDPPDFGYIYCGINRGLSLKDIHSSAENGTILKHMGRSHVMRGDYISIEPNTIHALTAGSFVYEIEQGEDNTYRLFDYERVDTGGVQRELQLNQALDTLDTSRQSTAREYPANTAITEKTYSTKRLVNITEYTNNTQEIECLTLLSGNASVDGIPLKTGMTVLIEPGERIPPFDIDECIVARPLL